MYYNKRRFVAVSSIILCLLAYSTLLAEPVSIEQARRAADTFLLEQEYTQLVKMEALNAEASAIQSFEPAIPQGYVPWQTKEILGDNGTVLAFVTELEPEGYIITSANTDINPVLGYSFEGYFPFEDSPDNVLLHLVQWDVGARLKALRSDVNEVQAVAQYNNELWESYALSDEILIQNLASATQWGPWITTNWYQSGRYNNKCPYVVPYVPGVRRPVGCVATAMAQIINYWEFPASVSFSSEDSYSENGISFDADASKYGFPTFVDMDSSLAVINYDDDDDDEVAYLNFAAGVKLEMEYGVFGSGANTGSVSRVLRNDFSYGSAIAKSKRSGVWSQYRSDAIENIKMGWPLQIAIHKSGKKGGHSVIVDGYRDSDGFFHVNFGWSGGTGTTWYDLPDSYGSYDVVHTVVYDICSSKGWSQCGADEKNSYGTIYAAPTTDPPADKWQITCASDYSFSGLSIGNGGKIYASCSPNWGGGNDHPSLWAINQYGEKEKEIVLQDENEGITYPAQNSKGEIFVSSDLGRVYRFDKEINTVTRIFTEPDGKQFFYPVKVDVDDNIYIATFYKLYSLTRTGVVRWSFDLPNNVWFFHKQPAIDSARNRVYIGYYNFDTDIPDTIP